MVKRVQEVGHSSERRGCMFETRCETLAVAVCAACGLWLVSRRLWCVCFQHGDLSPAQQFG